MIEREHGEYILVCDVCGDSVTLSSFDEAVEYKKENGWASRKCDGEWQDICRECK